MPCGAGQSARSIECRCVVKDVRALRFMVSNAFFKRPHPAVAEVTLKPWKAIWYRPIPKQNTTSTVYLCMASNLKALRNLFLNEKIHLCVGLSVCNICTIFMYTRGFIIVHLFRPWLRHNGLQNLIRVLHCMVNSNSYARIRVKITYCWNQWVDFSISVKKCWSKNSI